MPNRQKSRAARRAARRLAAGVMPAAGPAAAGPPQRFRISEIVYAADEPTPMAMSRPARSVFSDAGPVRPAPAGGTLGGTVDLGCFADAPPAVAAPSPPPGRAYADGTRRTRPDAGHVEVYLNLGSAGDFGWSGDGMGRRDDAAQVSTDTV